MRNEVSNLEKLGYIKRATLSHAYPIVVVKNGKKKRMCVDFRDLNKNTIPHHWPIPP